MAQITVDDPDGFDTVFSTDPSSPAAPYLRQFSPKSLEDLYDIGIIPAHVSIDTLRNARELGIKAYASPIKINNTAMRNLPVEAQRKYVQARSHTMSREASVSVTADELTRHGFTVGEADLLARKAHLFDEITVEVTPIVLYGVEVMGDLVVRTPLVIDSSIHAITAKAVVIHRSGEIRASGPYLLVKCDSFRGEGFWWQSLLTTTVTREGATANRRVS